jgi:hypothetical protein
MFGLDPTDGETAKQELGELDGTPPAKAAFHPSV